MTGRSRRPLSAGQRAAADEAREAKLVALHQQLSQQVSVLGQEWQRWLDMASKFHAYSFNNTLLLLAQNPEATHVAGYKLWQQLGRQVNKGEKGLAVFAPVTRKTDMATDDPPKQASDPPTSEPAATGSRRVVGFRPAYVWDVSQTSGDPLPEPAAAQLLAGHAPEGLWDALAAQCATAGFTVERRPIGGANGPNGYTAFGRHEVVVRSDVDDAQAVKTLAHELGHVLMHDPASFVGDDTIRCQGIIEVEAESVAYLVAADHGMDTSQYSFAYVAGWAAGTGDVQAALSSTGTRVLAAAHQVLDASHAHMTPVDPESSDQLERHAGRLIARAAAGAERTSTLRDTPQRPTGHQAAGRDAETRLNLDDAAWYYIQGPEQLTGRSQPSWRREEPLPRSVPGGATRPLPPSRSF
ncbi:MAG: ArdC-like ssDNA-binding domain-containing protein [Acidimicrobiales bacterium]